MNLGASPASTRQLETRIALAHLDGVAEDDCRRLIGTRLALDDAEPDTTLVDVDTALGCCLRDRCSTAAVWEAFERGIALGRLLVDVYRDGFVEGYRDAIGSSPVPLAAE
ncbi:MAG: hypothetical protein ACE37F_03830 [Nannocystaceae bacterium]|nr:hypothetical protein [bacterium]